MIWPFCQIGLVEKEFTMGRSTVPVFAIAIEAENAIIFLFDFLAHLNTQGEVVNQHFPAFDSWDIVDHLLCHATAELSEIQSWPGNNCRRQYVPPGVVKMHLRLAHIHWWYGAKLLQLEEYILFQQLAESTGGKYRHFPIGMRDIIVVNAWGAY